MVEGEHVTGTHRTFRDATDRVDALLTRADLREVDAVRADMREADRLHAMTLASVRNALALTQAEVAKRLKVSQGAVAQTEARSDLLVSTLRAYLGAMGAHVRVVVDLPDGRSSELALEELANDSKVRSST
jgi:DNA-binding transcriptional regulator YiaG